MALFFLITTLARQMVTMTTPIRIIRNTARNPITSPSVFSVVTGLFSVVVSSTGEKERNKRGEEREGLLVLCTSEYVNKVGSYIYEASKQESLHTFNLNPCINAAWSKAL